MGLGGETAVVVVDAVVEAAVDVRAVLRFLGELFSGGGVGAGESWKSEG